MNEIEDIIIIFIMINIGSKLSNFRGKWDLRMSFVWEFFILML